MKNGNRNEVKQSFMELLNTAIEEKDTFMFIMYLDLFMHDRNVYIEKKKELSRDVGLTMLYNHKLPNTLSWFQITKLLELLGLKLIVTDNKTKKILTEEDINEVL